MSICFFLSVLFIHHSSFQDSTNLGTQINDVSFQRVEVASTPSDSVFAVYVLQKDTLKLVSVGTYWGVDVSETRSTGTFQVHTAPGRILLTGMVHPGARVALPFVFLIFACVPSPPTERVWTLPRKEDPLGVFPEKQTFRVVYRDGAVYQSPPWKEEMTLPPGLVVRRQGQTFFWISRDQRALFRIRLPRVETLLSLPDSVPSALMGVDPEGDALLVTLTSRLVLFHGGQWWTLPFQGQTAALRVRDGTVEVFWAVEGW